MAPNLTSGSFKIVSLIDGNPLVGVGLIGVGFQFVHLNGTSTTWVVDEVGKNTYRLSVGGYRYTGIEDDKVTAYNDPDESVKWIATYREHRDAYTIEPDDDAHRGKVWSVPFDADANANAVIKIEGIISPAGGPGIPYSTYQLFRFVPVLE